MVEGHRLEIDGHVVVLDGFDPGRRIGYEYVTSEAGDREELTEEVIDAIERHSRDGDLFILLIDERDVVDRSVMERAAEGRLAAALRASTSSPSTPTPPSPRTTVRRTAARCWIVPGVGGKPMIVIAPEVTYDAAYSRALGHPTLGACSETGGAPMAFIGGTIYDTLLTNRSTATASRSRAPNSSRHEVPRRGHWPLGALSNVQVAVTAQLSGPCAQPRPGAGSSSRAGLFVSA